MTDLVLDYTIPSNSQTKIRNHLLKFHNLKGNIIKVVGGGGYVAELESRATRPKRD